MLCSASVVLLVGWFPLREPGEGGLDMVISSGLAPDCASSHLQLQFSENGRHLTKNMLSSIVRSCLNFLPLYQDHIESHRCNRPETGLDEGTSSL